MAIDLTASLVDDDVQEDVDPMSSVANLVDAMLVFACGLMLALVLAWNVDLSKVTQVQPTDQMTEVENVDDLDTSLLSENGTAYVDMGNVYMDPDTGKYYLVTNQDAADSGASDNGSAS